MSLETLPPFRFSRLDAIGIHFVQWRFGSTLNIWTGPATPTQTRARHGFFDTFFFRGYFQLLPLSPTFSQLGKLIFGHPADRRSNVELSHKPQAVMATAFYLYIHRGADFLRGSFLVSVARRRPVSDDPVFFFFFKHSTILLLAPSRWKWLRPFGFTVDTAQSERPRHRQ